MRALPGIVGLLLRRIGEFLRQYRREGVVIPRVFEATGFNALGCKESIATRRGRGSDVSEGVWTFGATAGGQGDYENKASLHGNSGLRGRRTLATNFSRIYFIL